MKKRRLKTWSIIIFIVFLILIICIISIISSLNDKKRINTKTIDTIINYNYNLKENESSYYKSLFKKLKEELSKKSIDEEKYANIISQMFLSDFLSLDTTINKNDIGGTDFVYEEYKDSFIQKAKDTLYLYVESNIYGNRNQELPSVKEVKVISIKKDEYNGDTKIDKEAFYVKCEVLYKKDLGYPKNISLILIHNDNKLEIVSME